MKPTAADAATQAFGPDEIADSVQVARGQPRWFNWVALPTVATRDFARGQLIFVQVAYLLSVLAILVAELQRDRIDRALLWWWLAESLGNQVLRVALFARMLKRPRPALFAGSPFWRLVPLTNNLIVGVHWVWTATIFITPEVDFVTVMIVVVFSLMSVAAVSISPASPITAVLYPGFLWASFVGMVRDAPWATPVVLAALLICVAAILLCAHLTMTGHVRKFLIKSDEVELLVEKLQESNRQLEQSNAALEVHRREARDELEARSAYFNAASHDLKQRLHALQLLSAAPAGDLGVRAGSQSSALRSAVDDLQVFLTDTLEFARCEHIAQAPLRVRVDLQELFQELSLQFEDVADARSVILRVRTTDVAVASDRLMLLRVLENLLSNAIKFCRPRGKVLVAARRRTDGVWLEVRDQGSGVSEAIQKAMFQPFYQRPYYGRRADGVGLGLAIVERLTHALGGAIEVRSIVGRGTLIRVILPLDPENFNKERSRD
jgi:signal transduction histidine kinase